MKQAPIKKTTQNTNIATEKDAILKARKTQLANTKDKGFKWLTKNSRDFLASGYITGNHTAEERIREIADRAEEILKIKGYSEKFYHYMSE